MDGIPKDGGGVEILFHATKKIQYMNKVMMHLLLILI